MIIESAGYLKKKYCFPFIISAKKLIISKIISKNSFKNYF